MLYSKPGKLRHAILSLTIIFNCSIVYSQQKTVAYYSKKKWISAEIGAFMTVPGKITTYEGDYKMKSHIQSSYLLGAYKIVKLSDVIHLSVGLQVEVGKRNWFVDLDKDDEYFLEGLDFIEAKDLWSALRLPVSFTYYLSHSKAPVFLKTGMALTYTGHNQDMEITWTSVAIDGNYYDIFDGLFKLKKQPWLYYIVGFGKEIPLKRTRETISVSLEIQLSPTHLCDAEYELTVPNRPITKGRYQSTGSGIGLTVQANF